MQILIPQADEVHIIIDEKYEKVVITIETDTEDVHSVEVNNTKYVKVHHVPFKPWLVKIHKAKNMILASRGLQTAPTPEKLQKA